MQIMIDLPPDLEQVLLRQAAQSNIPLKTLIIQALRQLAQTTVSQVAQWPEAVLSYAGVPDFPPLEAHREELLPPPEPEFF